MEPLEVLFEDRTLPDFRLPETLRKLYGGTFGFDEDAVVANFVASIDGVTAIPESERSSALISGGSKADRLVMGMLRAAADVLVVGAGTLRSHPRSRWTPEQAMPDLAGELGELRRQLGRSGDAPQLVVVTASGKLDPSHPALAHARVVSTPAGADATTLPTESLIVIEDESDSIPAPAVLDALRTRGARSILVEGGPHLLGSFVEDDAIDELFLTVSPVLAGRSSSERPGLIGGVQLLPDREVRARLLSVREHDSFLLLRYRLRA